MIDTNCSINKWEQFKEEQLGMLCQTTVVLSYLELGHPQEKKRYSIIMCILQDNQWANSLPEWATTNPLITRCHNKWFTSVDSSWNGIEVERPMIEILPGRYEMPVGDIRTNLLGLMLMNRLLMLDKPLLSKPEK